MTRPRKERQSRRNPAGEAVVHLRLPEALHDRIRAHAADDTRSVNAWCVLVLERHVAILEGGPRRGTP